jgi:DNA primase
MDAVAEIKQRLSIEDIISEYVQLKRAGRNFKGLSPFTSEKTPSFVVSPEKQIWHDFSSGKGGDMFSFVMEMEGLDFKGALELMAQKAGVDLEQFRTKPGRVRGPDKERLYEALDLAARFYQAQFKVSSTTLDYVFKKREFTKQTALEWRLGYSPNTGGALLSFLKNKGFTEQEIKQAGLSAERYGRTVDMFRGRLMIPLQDPQGRVVGFTARSLGDDKHAPKYINTPATLLYDKSRHIFGLHLAKETIRKTNFVVLVEGNLDVIASHQAGVRQVVATAGTAMTEPNLKALSRLTSDIRLCFDQDRAGIAATERAIPIAGRIKVSVSVIDLPSGKDPDELVKRDPELWRQAISQPKYALDWLIARYADQLDLSSAPDKRKFSDVMLPVVRGLSDEVERDHYVIEIADKIGVSKEALLAKLNGTEMSMQAPLKKPRNPKLSQAATDRHNIEHSKAQDHFLALALLQPQLRDYLEFISPDMFSSQKSRLLLDFLLKNPDFAGSKADMQKLADQPMPPEVTSSDQNDHQPDTRPVQSLRDYVTILGLQYEELYQGLELLELRHEAARLQARLIDEYVKHQKQNLIAQLNQVDEETRAKLLMEAKKLDDLLKHSKGGMHATKQEDE